METITDTAVRFVSGLRFADIPPQVVEAAKKSIVDCLGVSLAGLNTEAATKVIRLAQQSSGKPGARILGVGLPVALPMAALANGTLAHAHDYDDDDPFLMVGHPTSPVLSALVSLADTMKLGGSRFLEAFVVGVEIEMRVGAGMNPEHYDRGWHATGTLGTLGAAMACARLVDAAPRQVAHAMGIAASEVCGLKRNIGTMTKPFHVGLAAQHGVMAALLAQDGFTADEAILDGKQGFAVVFTSADEDRLRDEVSKLGREYAILTPGLAIKRYPCSSSSHSAIDAVVSLRHEHKIASADIVTIECGVGPRIDEIMIHPRPRTGVEAKFSMEYCLAIAAMKDEPGIDDFSDGQLREPDVQDMLRRVRVFSDPEIQRGPYGVTSRCRVRMKVKDGRVVERDIDKPRGSPSIPLTADELHKKFAMCAGRVLDGREMSLAFERWMKLEDASSIAEAITMLSKRARLSAGKAGNA